MRGVRGEPLAGSPQNVIGQADHLGLAWNFYFFAALNLAGALLDVLYHPAGHPDDANGAGRPLSLEVDRALRNPRLCAAFGIGFGILFVFIGAFTYVNFVLLRPPVFARPNGCWASLLPGRLDHAKVGSQKLSFHLGDPP